MPLLLTILSVIAAVAFVSVLGIALLLIFKVLQGVQRSLEQIAMGVRAIEKETMPLRPRAVAFTTALTEATTRFEQTNERLAQVDGRLDGAAGALTPRI